MPRRNLLTLKVSDEEKALLEELAEKSGGGGMSAYVRRIIRQEAERMGFIDTSTLVRAETMVPEAQAEAA